MAGTAFLFGFVFIMDTVMPVRFCRRLDPGRPVSDGIGVNPEMSDRVPHVGKQYQGRELRPGAGPCRGLQQNLFLFSILDWAHP